MEGCEGVVSRIVDAWRCMHGRVQSTGYILMGCPSTRPCPVHLGGRGTHETGQAKSTRRLEGAAPGRLRNEDEPELCGGESVAGMMEGSPRLQLGKVPNPCPWCRGSMYLHGIPYKKDGCGLCFHAVAVAVATAAVGRQLRQLWARRGAAHARMHAHNEWIGGRRCRG